MLEHRRIHAPKEHYVVTGTKSKHVIDFRLEQNKAVEEK